MTRCLALSVLLFSALNARPSDPLDHWHWRAPLPQGYSFHGATVTSNLFVAVGEFGTILLSTNGIDWLITNAPVITNLNSVCFTGDRFVVVGDGGTILTSTTGTDWTRQTAPTSRNLYSVTHGNGLVAAVGSSGTILTSATGSSWRSRNAGFDTIVDLSDVTFGAGQFVTVGQAFHDDFSTGISAISADGTNWQSANSGTLAPFSSVVYGNEMFLAAAGSMFAASPDGLHWGYYYLGLRTNAVDLDFAGGRFVAAGWSGILHSPDGTNWTAAVEPADSFRCISTSGGRGIAVGRTGRLAVSTNVTEWRVISSGPTIYQNSITFGRDRFVGVIGPNIVTSVGGHSWTHQTVGSASLLPNASLNGVAYGNGVFIAVGYPFYPITNLVSADGYSWTPLSIPTTNPLAAIAFINNRFLAVGEAGTVCESLDGTNWSTHFIADGASLLAVTHGNGRYVAAGVGAIYTSVDLENWTSPGGTNVNWYTLAYGNGMFVAGGVVQTGRMAVPALRSFDGHSWEPATSYPQIMKALAFGHGTFVAAASDGIRTSTNGLEWMIRTNRIFPTAQAVAFGSGTFVVSRFGGGIVQSDEVEPLVRLGAPTFNQGEFRWSIISGDPGSAYALQSSMDLKNWTNETTIIPLQFPFLITNQTSVPARFYRTQRQ